MSSMTRVGEYEHDQEDASLRKLAKRETQSLDNEMDSNEQEDNVPSLDKNHNKKIPNLKYAK